MCFLAVHWLHPRTVGVAAVGEDQLLSIVRKIEMQVNVPGLHLDRKYPRNVRILDTLGSYIYRYFRILDILGSRIPLGY